MEPLLIFSGLVGGAYYLLRKTSLLQSHTTPPTQVVVTSEYQRQNYIAKALQMALATLGETPDFQRALSWGNHAQQVPLWFRQQIFTRFRSRMVDHLAARLNAGEDATVLLEQLGELVQTLGMAAFEAEYIEREARQRITRRRSANRANSSYDSQLRSLRTAHEQRMTAIRSLDGIDPDVREQLLEAEQNRFRDAMIALGN